MHNDDYIRAAMKTCANQYGKMAKRVCGTDVMLDLLHGTMGIANESGELADAVKRHVFYGAPMDWTNVEEELGDLLWFISLCITSLRKAGHAVSFESIMRKNIAKLAKRFPDAFKEEDALERDLDAERKVLEE
jgi:NTP pyrophosphatase (non-canonical NTP hydrolase)